MIRKFTPYLKAHRWQVSWALAQFRKSSHMTADAVKGANGG